MIHGAILRPDGLRGAHGWVCSSTLSFATPISLMAATRKHEVSAAGTLFSMTDTMTITGLVATTPRHIITAEGLAVTSFRLASNLRRFDRKRDEWVDAGTNWYTVSAYRRLALNIVGSVQKGDRVLVTGRLRIREWSDGDKKGLNIDLDADALGHDLSWGKSVFTRSIHSSSAEAVVGSSAAGSGGTESSAAGSGGEDASTTESGGAESEGAAPAFVESADADSELEPVTPF